MPPSRGAAASAAHERSMRPFGVGAWNTNSSLHVMRVLHIGLPSPRETMRRHRLLTAGAGQARAAMDLKTAQVDEAQEVEHSALEIDER